MLLDAKKVVKYFPIKGGVFLRTTDYVHAVDCVDLAVDRGETVGLAGESGCGKTTLGKVILLLLEPTDGVVYFEGKNLFTLKKKEMRKMRREMQMVFQDPVGSLNPRMTVKNIISEPLRIHRIARGEQLKKKVLELLNTVGLKEEHLNRFPHEFSGGQRQRIGIARALALNPKFIVLDEPTSNLDVSVQAQILKLLQDLQKRLGLAYLFISHNLSVVRYLSQRIYIMYLGKIVESGQTLDIFRKPLHPYSQALISAVPRPDPDIEIKDIFITGEVPSAINPPSGCRFHPRCPQAMETCRSREPPSVEVEKSHTVYCHLYS